jgi:ribosomal protein S27E
MNIKTRIAGDFIDSQCTKCKILTNHTIVAIAAGKVARVKCNTCGGEHNYPAPKGEKVPSTKRSAVAKVSNLTYNNVIKLPLWHMMYAISITPVFNVPIWLNGFKYNGFLRLTKGYDQKYLIMLQYI